MHRIARVFIVALLIVPLVVPAAVYAQQSPEAESGNSPANDTVDARAADAEEAPVTKTNDADKMAAPARSVDAETRLIENWISLSGQFNDRLLATVYWSLAGVGGFLIVLIGFSWFTNYRIYDRDKTALTAELKAYLSREISQLRDELNKLNREHTDAIEKASSDAASAQISPLLDRLKKSEAAVEGIRTDFAEHQKEIAIELELHAARYWESQGIISNALSCHARAAGYAIELRNWWQVEMNLESIEQYLKAGGGSGSFESGVVEVLERLPTKFEPIKKRILSLLSTPT